MIALTDTHNRSLEIVERAGRKLAERLAFAVFEDAGFAGERGGMELREVASGDINGDGIGDPALLAHDKLIIYLGNEQARPAAGAWRRIIIFIPPSAARRFALHLAALGAAAA